MAKQLGGVESYYHEPEQLAAIRETVRRITEEDPSLKTVKLRVTPDIKGGYIPGRDTVALGVVNPAVAAHELGHAQNIRKSRIYGKILGVANDVARINNVAALPAMLGIRAFVDDPQTRKEIFNILTGASAVVAAPGLAEELSASVSAVKHAPDKLQAIKTLLPAFLHHTLHAMIPIGVYQLGKHI